MSHLPTKPLFVNTHPPTLSLPIILCPSRNHHCQSPILISYCRLPFFKLNFAQLHSVDSERWFSTGNSSKCKTESDWIHLGEMVALALAHLTLLAEDCMMAWRWDEILPMRASWSYYGDENGMAGVWRRTIAVEACRSEKDDDKGQWLISVQIEPRWCCSIGVYSCV